MKEFLNYAHFKPHRIIFIDDNREYLESVEEFAKEASIPYLGIHYTAALEKRKNMNAFNQKRAELQFEVLLKDKLWLSDSEADARMRNL